MKPGLAMGFMVGLVMDMWEFRILIYIYVQLKYSIIKILKHDITTSWFLYIKCKLLIWKQTAYELIWVQNLGNGSIVNETNQK